MSSSGLRSPSRTNFAALHEPTSNLCDDGFARALFRVGAPSDNVTSTSALHYAVFSARADGTFDRDLKKAQIATASCTAVVTAPLWTHAERKRHYDRLVAVLAG